MKRVEKGMEEEVVEVEVEVEGSHIFHCCSIRTRLIHHRSKRKQRRIVLRRKPRLR